jgi:hypothetical protein
MRGQHAPRSFQKRNRLDPERAKLESRFELAGSFIAREDIQKLSLA